MYSLAETIVKTSIVFLTTLTMVSNLRCGCDL